MTEGLVVVLPSPLKPTRLSTPHAWPQLPVGAPRPAARLLVEALVFAKLRFTHLAVAVAAAAVLTAALHGCGARENAHHGEDGEHSQSDVHVPKAIAPFACREHAERNATRATPLRVPGIRRPGNDLRSANDCLGSRCPCQGLVLVVAGVNVVVVADCVVAVVSGTALVVATGVVVVDATGELVELGLTAAVVAGG